MIQMHERKCTEAEPADFWPLVDSVEIAEAGYGDDEEEIPPGQAALVQAKL